MRTALVILAVTGGAFFAVPSDPKGESWKLVWEDDFTGKDFSG